MPHTPFSQNPLFYPYTPRYSWYAMVCQVMLTIEGQWQACELDFVPVSGLWVRKCRVGGCARDGYNGGGAYPPPCHKKGHNMGGGG